MGAGRRDGRRRHRRHAPVTGSFNARSSQKPASACAPLIPANAGTQGEPRILSRFEAVRAASILHAQLHPSWIPTFVGMSGEESPRIALTTRARVGITARDSSPRTLASRLRESKSSARGASRGAKSVFAMSQREVEMHIMESRAMTLARRLDDLSRRLRGRRNARSNGVQIR